MNDHPTPSDTGHLQEKLAVWSEATTNLFAGLFDEIQFLKSNVGSLLEEIDILVQLNIILTQLHSTRVPEDIYAIIGDILREFVGVEQFALVEFNPADQSVAPLALQGDETMIEAVLAGAASQMQQVSSTTRPYYSESLAHLSQAAESEPLLILRLGTHNDHAVLLNIHRFLSQKKEMSRLDFEIFRLLKDHAGIALENARTFSRMEGDLKEFASYERL